MKSEEDREYFAKRESQEREAAATATRGAKCAHTELADRYAALTSEEVKGPTKTPAG